MDESGIPLDPKPERAVCATGMKNPVAPSSGDKSQRTVVACVSAGGTAMPPMVILNRKTLPPDFAIGEAPGTVHGLSACGWIDQEFHVSFFEVCTHCSSPSVVTGWTLQPLLSFHHSIGSQRESDHFCSSYKYNPYLAAPRQRNICTFEDLLEGRGSEIHGKKSWYACQSVQFLSSLL